MSDPTTQISISLPDEIIVDEEKRDWTKLPESIFTQLNLNDKKSCRSVHSSWRVLLEQTTQWLLHKHCDKPIYNLFHPFYGYKQHDLGIVERHIDVVPRASRDGWMLLFSGQYSIFFFNPCTHVMIRLPDSPSSEFSYFSGISFSCHPTSSDCVIFGINGFFDELVCISTIRPGEEWMCDRYNNNLPFYPSFSSPVFHNGMVYHLDVYDLNKRTWTVLKDPQKPCRIANENYLVGCGGKLISVFLGRRGSWISVYKLNDLNMAWENVYNLGNHALFLSITSSFSTDNVLAIMKNKIFLPMFHDGSIVFYSFDTQKFQTFGSNLCTRNLQQCVVSEQLQSCWIERKEIFCWDDKKELQWVSNLESEHQQSSAESEVEDTESEVEDSESVVSSESEDEDSESNFEALVEADSKTKLGVSSKSDSKDLESKDESDSEMFDSDSE